MDGIELESEQNKLSRLLEKKEKIEKQIAQEKSKLNEKKRKERTRHLIQIGGLAEIAKIDIHDKGVLLGAFCEIFEKLRNGDQTVVQQWKTIGDRILSQREKQRKARDEDDGTAS